MSRRITFSGLSVILILLAGCATITNDKQHQLSFSSDPSDATVSINGQDVGETPVTINWERKNQDLHVTIEKEGYKTSETTIASSVDPIFFGNIIIGGLFGSTTDAATGKMWEYQRDKYHTTLVPEETAKTEPARWKLRRDTIRYSMLSYTELSHDIARGNGPYLSGLLSKLRVGREQREGAIKTLRGIMDSSDTVPEFARTVADQFSS